MDVIQYYALTNNSFKDVKKEFYDYLVSIIKETTAQDET